MTEIETTLFVMTIILFIWNIIITVATVLLYNVTVIFINTFRHIFNNDNWWENFIK